MFLGSCCMAIDGISQPCALAVHFMGFPWDFPPSEIAIEAMAQSK